MLSALAQASFKIESSFPLWHKLLSKLNHAFRFGASSIQN